MQNIWRNNHCLSEIRISKKHRKSRPFSWGLLMWQRKNNTHSSSSPLLNNPLFTTKILELINSPHCLNVQELQLNCKNLNESVFISLARTKNFPKLIRIIPTNIENCYSSLGYLARAKYFDTHFDLESSTLLKDKNIYQSNKFINNLISSIYMRNVKELHFDNMNDHMPALKEFFQLAKHC